MKLFLSTSITLLLLSSGTATWAAGAGQGPVQVAQADTAMADGEVRKVDKESKKITIKHGEIKNLEMPGMTMIFQVKDPSMLEKVKTGDKVRFAAAKSEGALVVTSIEVAQ